MISKPGFRHGFWALMWCLGLLVLLGSCGILPITTPNEVPDTSPTITSTPKHTVTSTATSTATSTPTSTPGWSVPDSALVSPDGMYYAMIQNGSRLIVVGNDGIEKEVAQSAEIIHFAWFPDSQHIVYVYRFPSDNPFIQYEHRLWIVDVDLAEPYEIEYGFSPLISPDGRHIAFMHGYRAGDACLVAFELAIMRLDDEFQPVSLIRQGEIQGIPATEELHSFLPNSAEDLRFPGLWQDASTLNVAMRWACVDEYGQNGIYTVDLGSNTAERIPGLSGDDGSMATYTSTAGRFSITYPATELILFVGEKPSVDGVLIPLPNSVSLQRTVEPSMLITIRYFQLGEESELSEFVAREDPCASGVPIVETIRLGQLEAIFLRDTPCGPYGYSLIAALHDGFGYLITIESHARFENIEEIVNAILETFMTD